MKAVAYALTAISALLAVAALIGVLFGATHQLVIAVICGLMSWAGVRTVREEKEAHNGR